MKDRTLFTHLSIKFFFRLLLLSLELLFKLSIDDLLIPQAVSLLGTSKLLLLLLSGRTCCSLPLSVLRELPIFELPSIGIGVNITGVCGVNGGVGVFGVAGVAIDLFSC